jgi:hypothetical protein
MMIIVPGQSYTRMPKFSLVQVVKTARKENVLSAHSLHMKWNTQRRFFRCDLNDALAEM